MRQESKRRLQTVAFLLVAISLTFYFTKGSNKNHKSDEAKGFINQVVDKNNANESSLTSDKKKKPSRSNPVVKISSSQASLKKLTNSFARIQPRSYKTDQFVELLGELSLEPRIDIGTSGNGKLTIIRTMNNLPGTRYIHAQFFGGGHKEFMQHLSFEYQKGKKSFEEVVNSIRSTFAIKPETEYTRGRFKKWDVGEDYEVWVKELKREDLGNDPFNAYDEEGDAGTIRVTLELRVN